MTAETEVICRVDGKLGRITLNRPKVLHALTRNMCQLMTQALLGWLKDPAVTAVLIDHSGDRGFCAGGDIRVLADSGAGDGVAARDFFFVEYRLNHLMYEYPKPIVTVMDGVTMGGGVGISLPARYRVATERTLFAMPETDIGLFPDVGGGWHLPRLPGHAGLWLALTSSRVKAADCLALGIATHFIASDKLEAFKAAVGAAPEAIEDALNNFKSDPGPAPVAGHLADIDRLYAGGSVEAVMAALKAETTPWAQAQLETLSGKSPQTLKVAFRQLQLGAAAKTMAENMAMEYRIGARVVRMHDFLEGVRAVIVDKDRNPKWDPATLDAVSPETLDAIFAPLPPGEEWSPLPELAS